METNIHATYDTKMPEMQKKNRIEPKREKKNVKIFG